VNYWSFRIVEHNGLYPDKLPKVKGIKLLHLNDLKIVIVTESMV